MMFSKNLLLASVQATFATAAITYKGYDLSSLTQMIEAEGANFYTTSGELSTAEAILGGNIARLR
jgi:arabinogalactan endo-1,4-beta-galactosidase